MDLSRASATPDLAGDPAPAGARDRPVPYQPRHAAKAKPPSTTRTVVEWVVILAGALVLALVVRNFVFTTYWIPSPSMEPTVMGHPGRHDRVIVNRLSYHFHAVRRGDIVVFRTPSDLHPVTEDGRPIKVLIKRVVGLPGDHVVIGDGYVHIDGKVLREPYLASPRSTFPVPISECPGSRTDFHIPKGDVLVLGDNRTNSEDGRCFGPVSEHTIVGRAFLRIWPLSAIGWL